MGHIDVEVTLPQSWHVVMGASGKAEQEVDIEALHTDAVPLYKRKGGGGTVLLGPGIIVVTVHAGVAHLYQNQAYFEAINSALIQVFGVWKSLPYCQKGICDIAVGQHKIVGCSIFRRKYYLLYQASILVDFVLTTMKRLLRHPPREPDYRKGRDHERFLTSLRLLGITYPIEEMALDLQRILPQTLPAHLASVDQTASDPDCL